MDIEELALLRAIDASPEDDLPRLVYADWLDDHGQPVRAEFIRLQCEIAKLEVGPRAIVDANYKLWKRQQAILDEHYALLIEPLAFQHESSRVEFSRGFVSEITVPVEDYFLQAGRFRELKPRPKIKVTGIITNLVGFLSSPALDIVHTISALDPRQTIPLDAISYLQDSSLYPLFSEALPRLVELQELALSGCELSDNGLAVFELGAFPKLKTLNLAFNQFTDEGVIYLLNLGLLQRLEVIILAGNQITDQGAIELADRLGRSDQLRHLNLRNTHIERAGQQALLTRFGSKVDLF